MSQHLSDPVRRLVGLENLLRKARHDHRGGSDDPLSHFVHWIPTECIGNQGLSQTKLPIRPKSGSTVVFFNNLLVVF